MDLAVLDRDPGRVRGEGGIEEELGFDAFDQCEILIVTNALGCRLVVLAPHDFGNQVCRGFEVQLIQFDHEIIKIGVVDVGVEDLPAPMQAVIVGGADMPVSLLAGQIQPVHRRLDSVWHRSDDPYLERSAQILEEKLSGKTVIDAVALPEQLGDRR